MRILPICTGTELWSIWPGTIHLMMWRSVLISGHVINCISSSTSEQQLTVWTNTAVLVCLFCFHVVESLRRKRKDNKLTDLLRTWPPTWWRRSTRPGCWWRWRSSRSLWKTPWWTWGRRRRSRCWWRRRPLRPSPSPLLEGCSPLDHLLLEASLHVHSHTPIRSGKHTVSRAARTHSQPVDKTRGRGIVRQETRVH